MDILSPPRLVERLIQQKGTGFYFKNSDEWTADRQVAKRFEDLFSVFEACHDFGLKGVQLVLKDLDADFEIQLDLDSPS